MSPDARESSLAIRGEINWHPDRALAELAARQHGVVARWQLSQIGVSRSTWERRLASGHLIPLHRGVAAVGHRRLRPEGHWLAAVLAAGPTAALSHRSAAALHGLRQSNAASVDVTVGGQRRRQPGIRIHRVEALAAADVTAIDGIPATTVARTLVDLAAVIDRGQLARAVGEAERRGVLDMVAVDAVAARLRTRNGGGHATLREVIADHAAAGASLTRSELEDRFLRLVDRAGLPRPRTNAVVEGVEVDAFWPPRLVVELDGWAFHRGRGAFERDRAKSNLLTASGHVVLRFTHRDVVDRPEGVAETIRAAQDWR